MMDDMTRELAGFWLTWVDVCFLGRLRETGAGCELVRHFSGDDDGEVVVGTRGLFGGRATDSDARPWSCSAMIRERAGVTPLAWSVVGDW